MEVNAIQPAPAAQAHHGPVKSVTRPSTNSSLRRGYIFDWILVVVCAVLAGALYSSKPVSTLLFRVGPSPGNENIQTDDYFAYPDRGEIIPTWLSAIIAVAVNFVVISVAQFWVRDMRDWHHGILGTAVALSVSTLFQVSIKILIGGVRPTFLDRCKPDMAKVAAGGQGYKQVYFDKSICTGDADKINDALESFPSGHSNAAFAALLFLSLYLNAKLKLWGISRGHGQVWKLILVAAPIWGATVLSLTRLIDHNHNWYDILAGAIIGIVFAFATYRAYYVSMLHPFYNHIPMLDGTLGPDGLAPNYDEKGRAIQLQPIGPAAV